MRERRELFIWIMWPTHFFGHVWIRCIVYTHIAASQLHCISSALQLLSVNWTQYEFGSSSSSIWHVHSWHYQLLLYDDPKSGPFVFMRRIILMVKLSLNYGHVFLETANCLFRPLSQINLERARGPIFAWLESALYENCFFVLFCQSVNDAKWTETSTLQE